MLRQLEGHTAAISIDDALWLPGEDSIADGKRADELRAAAGGKVVDRLDITARELFEGAIEDVTREFGGRIPDSVKVALADHVWCGVLAELAHVLDEGVKLLDRVPDRIVDLVMSSRKETRWKFVEETVLRIVARSVWRKVRVLASFGVLSRMFVLPAIRMLAVLCCKAPERHRAVVEYCVDPLGKQFLAETKDRLKRVLFEWLPRWKAPEPHGRFAIEEPTVR